MCSKGSVLIENSVKKFYSVKEIKYDIVFNLFCVQNIIVT